MSADDVLKTIKEKEVRFVDLRFTDTIGKEQHVSLPVAAVDGDLFEDGIGINKLTSPDPAPPNGGAVFHDTAVWLKPAGG